MTGLIAAIAGPVVAGVISLILWQSKKNSEQVQEGLINLHDCVHEVSRKVDDVQIDIAKNYCTKDELMRHIEREEDWHDQHHTEVKELRQEFKEKTDKLGNDLSQIKDTQWQMRMEQLDRDNEV